MSKKSRKRLSARKADTRSDAMTDRATIAVCSICELPVLAADTLNRKTIAEEQRFGSASAHGCVGHLRVHDRHLGELKLITKSSYLERLHEMNKWAKKLAKSNRPAA